MQRYNSFKSDADKEHLSVNLFVKKRMTESVHGQTGLTPEILLKLTGLYNMLTLPACKWNDDMKNSYDAEMGRLYGELFR